MSAYTLSTGEAVRHVLEGRECESEDGSLRMRLSGLDDSPALIISEGKTTRCVRKSDASLRWRRVPEFVKREEALRALAAGKTIVRGKREYSGSGRKLWVREPWVDERTDAPTVLGIVEDFLDDSACWEVVP